MFLYFLLFVLVIIGFKFPVFTRTVIVPLSFSIPGGSILWAFLIQNNDELFSFRGYASVIVGCFTSLMLLCIIAEVTSKQK